MTAQVPKRITIHCSATPNGHAVAFGAIKKFHTDPKPQGRGWSDIGYHAVIHVDGSVEHGRSLNVVGAHVESANQDNVGICLIGTDKFTARQFEALRYQLDSIILIYPIPPWEIYVHNQWPTAIKQGKTCPGFNCNKLLAWYLSHRNDAMRDNLQSQPI